MSIYPEIVRNAMISPTLTLLAYIKPGVYHRYSPDKELMDIIGIGPAIYDVIVEAVKRGVSISKGDLPASKAQLGKLICVTLKKAFTWFGRLDITTLELVTLYPLLASAMSYLKHKGKLSEASLPSTVHMLLTASTKEDALEFYNTIRVMNIESYVRLMDEYGISRGKIEIESYNLYDLLSTLSKERPVYSTIINYSILATIVKECILGYENSHDINYAIIRGYLSLLKNVGQQLGLSTSDIKMVSSMLDKYTTYSKELLKILYGCDKRFRRYSNLISGLPILSNATFIALTLRIRP